MINNKRISSIEGKMQAIEQKIHQKSSAGDQADFEAKLESKMSSVERKFDPAAFQSNPVNNLTKIKGLEPKPLFQPARMDSRPADPVRPLAQNNSVSCGQTSVAMAVNSLTGKNLKDYDIDAQYGFGLMNALNAECSDAGYEWKDAGNINERSWPLIDRQVNEEKRPVIVALNGPEFSPSGRGHIVTIVKTEGDTVTYADPANGQLKTTSKQNMTNAASHPDGNFVFYSEARYYSGDTTTTA